MPELAGHDRNAEEQSAYLLVKLELATRREIGSHFTRHQSSVPGVDKLYQRLLVKNMILPAAVAGAVFADTVPNATPGTRLGKMVVDDPRNPNNRGDEVALELLAELRAGAGTAERTSHDAYYYAEPIKAKAACMLPRRTQRCTGPVLPSIQEGRLARRRHYRSGSFARRLTPAFGSLKRCFGLTP
ncbi:MAG: DUF3365 domain-containing protein [Planctomycetes bacterium]|nr:DUF3365 domain-containing protein [Planctomycetota bacterium]